MARLDTSDRAKLPDKAFAYVDGRGNRRLPIHDAAHVRNALARFNQVSFEDEKSRELARKRLLNAARKFRIVPVGFITGQLESERRRPAADDVVTLPSGFLTLMLIDIEGSTGLLHRLGDQYGALLDGVLGLVIEHANKTGGIVVERRADELFAVFTDPAAALTAAIEAQVELAERRWFDDERVRVRIGIHSGYPTRSKMNYIGMAVHTAARICTAAHGGQIVVSADTRLAVGAPASGVRFRRLGLFTLRGIPDDVELYQVGAKGLASKFPPPRIAL